jgi:superfamily I DNA/RNA helicase
LSSYTNIEVQHLDGLMARTFRAAGIPHPGYAKQGDGSDVARAALAALHRARLPRYRVVLLDEAQDFGTDALRFAVALLGGDSQDLVIVADAAQNIFRRRFTWAQAGIQAQGRTRILRKNYRNTREILECAYGFLSCSTVLRTDDVPDAGDENAIIPPEAALRSGEYPRVMLTTNEEEEFRLVLGEVQTWLAR